MSSTTPVRDAWRSVRQAGLIAPELPSIVFVAVASSCGFGWGVGAGALAVVTILVARRRRALPVRLVVSSVAGLAIAAFVAHLTGVAASGVLPDVCLDAGIAAVLWVSILVHRPLFGVLWSVVRRRPLLRDADPGARRGYYLTTAVAAAALTLRSLVMAAVYADAAPVGWLLGVRVALGLPVTLIVVAAAYAAAGFDATPSSGGPVVRRSPEGHA